jgi:hypothetical protein
MHWNSDQIEADPDKHALVDEGPKRWDWKGLATLITALLAVLGFFWNKAEGCSQANQSSKVQQVSYEALAAKLDGLYDRVGTIEQVVRLLPALFSKKQADAEKMVSSLPKFKPGELPKVVVPTAVLEPPEKLFQKSQLPTFQELKAQAAKSE